MLDCNEQGVNFFVSLLFLRLLEQLGPQVLYTMFSSACVVGAIFVRRHVVETKGKTLQEIEVSLLQTQ
ncbi:unnamed protein product [Triticum turgidum subsp. durum]|uniref:Uncharacterized protein n=1 Tax=Triticum turgidum subsp. durum TaxID=4567 RepID=A0A9R1C5Q4_TRITD|nr:unnamed protein product [Triticum turgidum subsp. durum]